MDNFQKGKQKDMVYLKKNKVQMMTANEKWEMKLHEERELKKRIHEARDETTITIKF